jgi:hypothetical protein
MSCKLRGKLWTKLPTFGRWMYAMLHVRRPPAVKKLVILPAFGRLLKYFCKAAGQGCWAKLPSRTAGPDCRARLPVKTAGQDCRARLPGKTAGQDWRARLPGKTAGQDCWARLPGKTDEQDCWARLPGKAAGQYCQGKAACNGARLRPSRKFLEKFKIIFSLEFLEK